MVKPAGRHPRKSPLKRLQPLSAPGGSRGRQGPTVANAGTNIKVVVRVRPTNNRENANNNRTVVNIVDDKLIIFDPEEVSDPFFFHGVKQRGCNVLKKAHKNMKFLVDRVFGFDSTNQNVFEHTTRELIGSLMDGYNCSVFVYGATGAGKTHTMLGNKQHPGITFLTMAELFCQKQALLSERNFELGVSYLEVYNENVQDLLNPGTPLHLREDAKYGVTVAGIRIKKIKESAELLELLEKGNKNRTQHPTDANAESSRSHAVFQVYITMETKTTGQVKVAKLSMIDLAGSERGAATGCAGARFTEGANINKSLLALGNCINSLADGKRHVPYRDSKLTRLLKDSLGGNCQTVMIANVSPSSSSYEDTYNTLKYADRAKKIKSNVKKNVVNCKTHVEQYVAMVEELNKEVRKLEAEVADLKRVNEAFRRREDDYKVEGAATCDCECRRKNAASRYSDGITPVLPVIKTEVPDIETKMHDIKTKVMDKDKLMQLFAEKSKVVEKIQHLKSTHQMLELQRETKIVVDSRLNDFFDSITDKAKARMRIDGMLVHLQKQLDGYEEKSAYLHQEQRELTKEVANLVMADSDLALLGNLEELRLENLACKLRIQHLEKLNNHQMKEKEKLGELISSCGKVLRPCYMRLRGYELAPESIIIKYRQLIKKVQGIDSVTWQDENDPGLSDATHSDATHSNATRSGSLTSLHVFDSTEDIPQTSNVTERRTKKKRKLDGGEEETSKERHLNETFVKTEKKEHDATFEVKKPGRSAAEGSANAGKENCSSVANAEQTSTKGCEAPPAKKVTKVHSASPHVSRKETRPVKKIGTMGTSKRFLSASTSGINKNRKVATLPKKS